MPEPFNIPHMVCSAPLTGCLGEHVDEDIQRREADQDVDDAGCRRHVAEERCDEVIFHNADEAPVDAADDEKNFGDPFDDAHE